MFIGIEFWTAFFIFFGYCIIDIASSWFIIELGKLHKTTTTVLTFLLYMGTGTGIYQYTHHYFYLILAALGASLGNFILVTIAKKKAS
jgi:hypothetical protein